MNTTLQGRHEILAHTYSWRIPRGCVVVFHYFDPFLTLIACCSKMPGQRSYSQSEEGWIRMTERGNIETMFLDIKCKISPLYELWKNRLEVQPHVWHPSAALPTMLTLIRIESVHQIQGGKIDDEHWGCSDDREPTNSRSAWWNLIMGVE